LIFTRTKHGANRLTQQLCDAGIDAAAIHGNKSQAARVKALEMFKRGQVRALVATEVAARGLDIKELPQVVNFELPNVPEDYVHRIGRTGRAGAAGEAVSLISGDEGGLLRDIERVLRRTIPVLPTPQFKILESVQRPSAPAQRDFGRPHGARTPGDRAPGNRAPGNRGSGGRPQGGQRDQARHAGGQARRPAQDRRGGGNR
jgi:ATP-dependent RNA helicase RhlE